MITEFTVDLDTGILTVNEDATYATVCDLVNGETDLLIDGYGDYTLRNGNVFLDESPFVQPARTITARGTLTLADGTVKALTSEHVVRFSINTDIGKTPPIGATPASSYTLALANSFREWDYGGTLLGENTLDGATVYLEVGATNYADVFTYVGWGRFIVDKVDNQDYNTVINLSGSDYMGNKMMALYTDSNSYPATYQTIVADACIQGGIHLKGYSVDHLGVVTYDAFDHDDHVIGVAPVFTGTPTCRDIVGWIAMMAGANAYINRDGELEIIPIAETYEDIDAGNYKRLTVNMAFSHMNYAIYLYAYGAPAGTAPLSCIDSTIVGAPYYIMEIKDNPYLAHGIAGNQGILDTHISKVADWIRNRASASVEWQGNNTITIGDTVNVTRPNGRSTMVGVLQQRIEFDTGLSFESGCDLSGVTLSNSFAPLR